MKGQVHPIPKGVTTVTPFGMLEMLQKRLNFIKVGLLGQLGHIL